MFWIIFLAHPIPSLDVNMFKVSQSLVGCYSVYIFSMAFISWILKMLFLEVFVSFWSLKWNASVYYLKNRYLIWQYYVQHFNAKMTDILPSAYPVNNVHFRTIIFYRDGLSSRNQFQENNSKAVNITLFSQLLICIVPVWQ